MDSGINFYELKTQLADLGFVKPEVADQLRELVLGEQDFATLLTDVDGVSFSIELERNTQGYFVPVYNLARLENTPNASDQLFAMDVPANEATKLLQSRPYGSGPVDTILGVPMNLQQVSLINAVRANGFNEPGLEDKLLNAKGYGAMTDQEVGGVIMPVNIILKERGDLEAAFRGYELTPRITETKFEHYKDNGVDTRELESRMAAIDWQRHPDHWITEKEAAADPELAKMHAVFADLKKLTTNYDARNDEYQWLIKWATGGLTRKYFADTPVEKVVTGKDGHGRYLFRGRLYFPPNVHIDIPAKLIHKPGELNSMSYALSSRAHKSQNPMNTENLNYLQKQLLNLGFGEQMNADLEKNITAKMPEFTLSTTQEYNKQNVDYILHYKAGDKDDMYFFNKYDAAMQGKEMQQTFYINKGSGITAKEAYNLMDGRAVHKQLENQEGEKYNAWLVLDKANKTESGNHKLNHFTDKWNYKPERAIDKMDIVGIGEEGAREKLLKSLEKGNRHQVTAMKDGKEVKLWLEANPAEHRVNLTNYKCEAQKLEHYKKPELKTEQKKDQKQAQAQEDAPEKKQSRKRGKKMAV